MNDEAVWEYWPGPKGLLDLPEEVKQRLAEHNFAIGTRGVVPEPGTVPLRRVHGRRISGPNPQTL